jgi:hypothetical protein
MAGKKSGGDRRKWRHGGGNSRDRRKWRRRNLKYNKKEVEINAVH